jgi:glucosamine-phosphate N-acetyltransferase
MATFKGLFEPSLISPAIKATFDAPLTIRPLERGDYAKGFLDCLRVLTWIGDVSEERFNERYDWMNTHAKGGYYILVIDDGTRILGTGALIVERKLYVPLIYIFLPAGFCLAGEEGY